jgi:hypothetical protein
MSLAAIGRIESMRWERARPALKRLASAVRFRPWPPCFQTLTNPRNPDLVPIGPNSARKDLSPNLAARVNDQPSLLVLLGTP